MYVGEYRGQGDESAFTVNNEDTNMKNADRHSCTLIAALEIEHTENMKASEIFFMHAFFWGGGGYFWAVGVGGVSLF